MTPPCAECSTITASPSTASTVCSTGCPATRCPTCRCFARRRRTSTASPMPLGGRFINVAQAFGSTVDVAQATDLFAGICERASRRKLLVTLEPVPGRASAASRSPRRSCAGSQARNARIAIDAWGFFRGGSRIDDLRGTAGPVVRQRSAQRRSAPGVGGPVCRGLGPPAARRRRIARRRGDRGPAGPKASTAPGASRRRPRSGRTSSAGRDRQTLRGGDAPLAVPVTFFRGSSQMIPTTTSSRALSKAVCIALSSGACLAPLAVGARRRGSRRARGSDRHGAEARTAPAGRADHSQRAVGRQPASRAGHRGQPALDAEPEHLHQLRPDRSQLQDQGARRRSGRAVEHPAGGRLLLQRHPDDEPAAGRPVGRIGPRSRRPGAHRGAQGAAVDAVRRVRVGRRDRVLQPPAELDEDLNGRAAVVVRRSRAAAGPRQPRRCARRQVRVPHRGASQRGRRPGPSTPSTTRAASSKAKATPRSCCSSPPRPELHPRIQPPPRAGQDGGANDGMDAITYGQPTIDGPPRRASR